MHGFQTSQTTCANMLIKRSLERQNVLEQAKNTCDLIWDEVNVKSTPFEFGPYDSPDCVAQ